LSKRHALREQRLLLEPAVKEIQPMTRRFMVVPVLFTLLLGFACATTNQATRPEVDDSMIATNVRSTIDQAVPGKVFAVEVKVTNGIVTLNGHAKSEDDRRAIADAANGIRGVKSVINNITIEP
jgi:hypothetical protein